MRKYNKEVHGADKYGGGTTTVGDVTEARNGLGEVVERFIKPRKRPLSELLDEDLARFAEVKFAKWSVRNNLFVFWLSGNNQTREEERGGGNVTSEETERKKIMKMDGHRHWT